MDELNRLLGTMSAPDCPINRSELADRSGVDEGTISKIFSGKTRNPGVLTVEALVSAMDSLLAEKAEAKGAA